MPDVGEEEGGYCGDCKFARGVDEKTDTCGCTKNNPHRDWRYRNNEPCPEWESAFDWR